MLLRKRVRLLAGFLLVSVAIYSLFLIYKSQDKYRHAFKLNMEVSFSEITGSAVSIERISGNPFRKIFFKGMVFDFGKYSIDFDWASLEYSLLDILSDRIPETGIKETVLTLGRGKLVIENGTIISKGISGKIRLRQGSILLDEMDFTVFDQFACCLNGEIATNINPQRLELSLDVMSIFDKHAPVFNGLRMLASGPLDNLSIRGKAYRGGNSDLHFRMYSIYNDGIFTIGSRIGLESEGADIQHILSADTIISPGTKEFNSVLMPNAGKISVKGKYDDNGRISAELKNQQLKIFGQDFSNIIYLNLDTVLKNKAISHFLLDLNTEASVINHWPASEIEASLIIGPERLRVVYAKVGDAVSASGFFDIKPPRKLDISINFTELNLEEFLMLMIENRPDVSGVISGNMAIEGLSESPRVNVYISAKDGNISDINYNRIQISADGIWPHLHIKDSRITYKDSSLNLEGELNMRNFGTGYFMEDIVVSTTDNTIVWEGWDITRIDESREFLLQRSLGSGIRMGYKTRTSDETRYEPVKQRDEFQLEYNILDDDSVLEFRAKESEEFFGIKKKYKF
jgi:hypothetical protein